jgi:hypothetical protein
MFVWEPKKLGEERSEKEILLYHLIITITVALNVLGSTRNILALRAIIETTARKS